MRSSTCSASSCIYPVFSFLYRTLSPCNLLIHGYFIYKGWSGLLGGSLFLISLSLSLSVCVQVQSGMYKLDSIYLVVVPPLCVFACFIHSKRLDFHIVRFLYVCEMSFFSIRPESFFPTNLSHSSRDDHSLLRSFPRFHLTLAKMDTSTPFFPPFFYLLSFLLKKKIKYQRFRFFLSKSREFCFAYSSVQIADTDIFRR